MGANKLVEERTKLEEQVSWLRKQHRPLQQHNQQQQDPHRMMKLKSEPGTSHCCGDERGPHPWHRCPATSKTFNRCEENDHFSRICMEEPTLASVDRVTLWKLKPLTIMNYAHRIMMQRIFVVENMSMITLAMVILISQTMKAMGLAHLQ